MDLAQKVAAAVSQVCPIDGISIGDSNDRKTWRLDFSAEATEAQKSAARSVLTAIDPNALSPDEVRAATFKADTARIDIMARLKASTPAQIDAWVANNLTTIPKMQAAFAALLKAIATDVRQ